MLKTHLPDARFSVVLWLPAIVVLFLSGCGEKEFARGFATNPDFRREEWIQPVASNVDVLFVIDTSCSMEDEQEALATNGPSFIEFFIESSIPFHIGATSTNVNESESEGLDGQLVGDPYYITELTANVAEAFLERTLMGIDAGHRSERGLHAAYTALEELGGTENIGFVRPDANLVIIVVSDEPDYSSTEADDASVWMDHEDFSEWLDGFKGSPSRSQLSAIVGISEAGFDDPAGCNEDETGENSGGGAKRGTGYLEAAVATGGSYLSICNEDWGDMLSRLSLIAAGLQDTFAVSEPPRPQTLVVKVNGAVETRWVLLPDQWAIYFDEVAAIPPAGAEVTIEYDIVGSG